MRGTIQTTGDDVLNGIAFDDASGTLLLTGKHWPLMFLAQLPE
jgi:glutamine cyclotransferase